MDAGSEGRAIVLACIGAMLRAIAGGAAQPHHLHAACGNGGLQVPYTYRLFNPGTYPRLNPRLSYYSFDVRQADARLACLLQIVSAIRGQHACILCFARLQLCQETMCLLTSDTHSVRHSWGTSTF